MGERFPPFEDLNDLAAFVEMVPEGKLMPCQVDRQRQDGDAKQRQPNDALAAANTGAMYIFCGRRITNDDSIIRY